MTRLVGIWTLLSRTAKFFILTRPNYQSLSRSMYGVESTIPSYFLIFSYKYTDFFVFFMIVASCYQCNSSSYAASCSNCILSNNNCTLNCLCAGTGTVNSTLTWNSTHGCAISNIFGTLTCSIQCWWIDYTDDFLCEHEHILKLLFNDGRYFSQFCLTTSYL